jgi:hypothetical protein
MLMRSVGVETSADAETRGEAGAIPESTTVNGSGAAYVFTRSGTTWSQQALVKASNPQMTASFGQVVSLVGETLAVGAPLEGSAAIGIDCTPVPDCQRDTSAIGAGAAYVFTRSGTSWSQQAYVKASNTNGKTAVATFGHAVALSPTGDALAVAASRESSSAILLDGDEADVSASAAGAVYLFSRTGAKWKQDHYAKATNTRENAMFGSAVAHGGTFVVIGSSGESSKATGIDGDAADSTVMGAGAVYVY